MPSYDITLFNPPAPVTNVTVLDPESGAIASDVPMLIDTGSDVTLFPKGYLRQLGSVAPSGDFKLRAFDGSTSTTQGVHLHLKFLGKTFRGEFLLIDQEYGIIGRDVLNYLSLVFDGPRLTWEEQRSPSVRIS